MSPAATSATILSTIGLLNLVDEHDTVVVDTRTPDAYNGWALEGISRGGHLPEAVNFAARWLDAVHERKAELLAAALISKGITRDKQIVLYSTSASDRVRVAGFLTEAGFRNLYSYDLNLWVKDTRRPLVQYENYHWLVPASIVKRLLDGDLPETFRTASRFKFAEVSWGTEEASYLKGHVPGSFHVNTDDFEPPPKWKLGDPDQLNQFAVHYGLQVDDTVVISGEDPLACYRLAVVLRWMGVRDVRVLNGGFAAWKSAHYNIETKSHAARKGEAFGAQIPLRPHLIANTQQVKAGLRRPSDYFLVDTRTWAEFVGETSGYDYHQHRGRIPGSTYGQAEYRGADSLTPYRNIDNTMRSADEILALWSRAGIRVDKHLSFMCGGGWRAAEVLTYAHVIGVTNTSLYSDGWIGWSSDRSNRVDTASVTTAR